MSDDPNKGGDNAAAVELLDVVEKAPDKLVFDPETGEVVVDTRLPQSPPKRREGSGS